MKDANLYKQIVETKEDLYLRLARSTAESVLLCDAASFGLREL